MLGESGKLGKFPGKHGEVRGESIEDRKRHGSRRQLWALTVRVLMSLYILVKLGNEHLSSQGDNDVMPFLYGQIILEGKTISQRNLDYRLILLKISLF